MLSAPLFCDRDNAGSQLADAIASALAQERAQGVAALPAVYALPRGGIPVALPVARSLHCPLDILVAKKISRPENPELALGAVTADGSPIWTDWAADDRKYKLQAALESAREKAKAQLEQLRPYCPAVSPTGAIAIIVDDGIATGMTAAAAAIALRAQNPAQVWIAAPVAPPEAFSWLRQWADRAIVLQAPDPFFSVSRFYLEFPQVEMAEAQAYLREYNQQLV